MYYPYGWVSGLCFGFKGCYQFECQVRTSFGDSKLIINQIKGVYNTKNENLHPYDKLVAKMVEWSFARVQFEIMPRNSNIFVDAMANLTSLTSIYIEDEETMIKINNLKNKTLIDKGFFVNFFEK